MFAHHGLKLCRRPWSAAFYCAPDLFLPEFSTRNQTVYCVLGISDKFDDVCRRMVLKVTRHWAFKARLVHQCETHIYVDVCDWKSGQKIWLWFCVGFTRPQMQCKVGFIVIRFLLSSLCCTYQYPLLAPFWLMIGAPFLFICMYICRLCLQCFNTVGWASRRASSL